MKRPCTGRHSAWIEPERAVAVLDRVDDDADADEVVDLVELLAAHDHLLVDRPVVLRPAAHVGADLELVEAGANGFEHLREVGLPLPRRLEHHRLDLGVPLGVQHREREILELPLDVLHAEAVRERRVDVERLLRDAPLLRLRQRRDGSHVVQAVGELDQQDAHVLGHRDEHLAHGRGLLGLLGVELEAVELGDPVDDGGDVGPKSATRSSRVSAVSSTASWSSAPASVTSSRPRSARIIATPIGCAM